MYFCVLGFLLGILMLQWLSALPSLYWFLPISIFNIFCWYFSPPWLKYLWPFIFCLCLGCAYAVFHAQQTLRWELPSELEGKTMIITGFISSLPKIQGDTAHFELTLQTLNHRPQASVKFLLTWYQFHGAPFTIGDSWQMQVRLKRPHGLVNPGSFDYEKWLFSRSIRATGYVIDGANSKLLVVNPWKYPIDRLRQYLQMKIEASLSRESTSGLIIALIMGAQNGITQAQWQVMRATGTNHLMAIAGVHIGFIAGFIYFIVNYLWRRIPRASLLLPAPLASAIGSLFFAIIYSALAGFALPTQRALVMLFFLMLSLFLRIKLRIWNSYVLAVLVILVYDSFSIFSVSFWLSFGAVFAIIYGISARLKPAGLWWKYGRVQWVITIGLIPISLVLFQQSSLVSILANTIAVPAVGILVLPLCLTGALLILIFQPLGEWILYTAAKIIAGIWWILAELSKIKIAVWHHTMPNNLILAAAIIGTLLIIAPKGLPGRCMGLFWLFPLFFFHPLVPKAGEVWLTLLDVGQGLSVVLRTRHHILVFDTGPKMGKLADAGERVIIPFFEVFSLNHINKLIVSHGDMDHMGGAASLLKRIPVDEILTSVPQKFSWVSNVHICQTGQTWEWDGFTFRVIFPPSEYLHQGNNSSCVLRVEKDGKGLLLLTGDIEKSSERYLVQHAREWLAAEVLVAPHHGSRTSSTSDFVNRVRANYILFSVGYRNRYQFPSKSVLQRYRKTNATLLNTADSGAITIKMNTQLNSTKVSKQRETTKKIWY